ncbi:hypothetical protein W97_01666 [Coniosporium apollinis CBS 100218]|uniref:MobA-like NTP transferase domain-containing protein n=1 Tax=Coniosporium apollinis (strain CBS 100218) TaxID=1168221 RepID=R7YKV2_CONA1|nr:uncharacterized protein W97_01666 [Coniosporium apollinis CBS 100218]EON62444.1 hypothetical protein W97_01666 [Coniosporium apollinis CBS 100218]
MELPEGLQPLLLAGGLSSRMGTPKHLLPFKDGEPVYKHLLRQLREACPNAKSVFVSLRDPQQMSGLTAVPGIATEILHDGFWHQEQYRQGPDIGPAAGLLAAHKHSPHSHWLVLACDYPFVTTAALIHLNEQFEEPLTCFKNEKGFVEPLIAIWSPQALRQLEDNVRHGMTGPTRAVKMLDTKAISPLEPRTLMNTNTKEEWDKAIGLAGII